MIGKQSKEESQRTDTSGMGRGEEPLRATAGGRLRKKGWLQEGKFSKSWK